MSEETTKNFENGESFEARVLSSLADIKSSITSFEVRLASIEQRVISLEERMTALEEKVDARLRETRPIWESVLTRLDLMNSKLGALADDMLTMRGEVNMLKKLVPPAA